MALANFRKLAGKNGGGRFVVSGGGTGPCGPPRTLKEKVLLFKINYGIRIMTDGPPRS